MRQALRCVPTSKLLRTLITDIIVDVDDESRDVILLTIHWRGGQHSELRVRKPRTGEHGCATAEDALAVMRSMAGRWSDEHIAASLNRMGLPTGQGKTWTAHRVASVRRVRGIHAYRSAEKDGEWLTMPEAAKALGTTNHSIRRLIKAGVLSAVQVVPGAPYQIRAADLALEPVKAAVARRSLSRCRRGHASNVYRYLTRDCTMTHASRRSGARAGRDCCRGPSDRHRSTGSARASGTAYSGRRRRVRICVRVWGRSHPPKRRAPRRSASSVVGALVVGCRVPCL